MGRHVALVLLLLGVLLLVFAVPAYADGPVVTTEPYQTEPWVFPPGWPCQDFGVTVVIHGDVRMTDWYNSAGLPVMGNWVYPALKAFFTNDATGKTVEMINRSATHYTVAYNGLVGGTYESADWTWSYTGADGFVIVPRAGAVFGCAGRQWWVERCDAFGCATTESSVHGRCPGFEDTTGFCAALAAP